jgi:hypothetical protein
MSLAAASRARRWNRHVVAWSGVLTGLLCTSSCLDEDEKCDANQVHVTRGQLDFCECAPDSVAQPSGAGCLRCAAEAHEVPQAGKCECAPGFVRASGGGACEAAVGQALGATCTGEGSCSAPYPYCASDGADKYCTTQGCTSNKDCPASYRCEQPGAGGFCAKVSGLTTACTAAAECAGLDASDCNPFLKQCVIPSCKAATSICPNGFVCCDLSAIMPNLSTCSAGATCSPPGQLVSP